MQLHVLSWYVTATSDIACHTRILWPIEIHSKKQAGKRDLRYLVNCQDVLSILRLSWHYVSACLKSYFAHWYGMIKIINSKTLWMLYCTVTLFEDVVQINYTNMTCWAKTHCFCAFLKFILIVFCYLWEKRSRLLKFQPLMMNNLGATALDSWNC